MDASVTIIVEAEAMDPAAAETALSQVGTRLRRVGESRSVGSSAKKAFKWILDFTGDTAKAGEALIEQATRELAGATVKIQAGNVLVEVTNVNRSQILDVMAAAAATANDAHAL